MFGRKKKEEEPSPALRAAARAFHALTQEKDWSRAVTTYSEALELCGTGTIEELALRGEVCMFYGFALKNLHDLESISERNPPTAAQTRAAAQINRMWSEMLDIYSRIPYESHRMDSRMVDQIRNHWIMSDNPPDATPGPSGRDRRELASEQFNMAHESIRAGNRAEAVQHYLKSMELAGEDTSADRTFKAFVAYQCGVCVLSQLQMQGVDPAGFSRGQKEGATTIRNLWRTTLRLYQTLDQSDLQTDFGSLLRKHVPAITNDPIMR